MYDRNDDENSTKELAKDDQSVYQSNLDIDKDMSIDSKDRLNLSHSANDHLQGTDATRFSAALERANHLASLGYSKEQIIRALFGESSTDSNLDKTQLDKTQKDYLSGKSNAVPEKVTAANDVGEQLTQQLNLKGKTFGKYEILDLIGKGGMSTVYRTNNLETKRIVACKVLLPRLLDDKKNRRRFEHEAEAAKRLTHQNIINVHDFGETDGQPYMIMDYLDGISLSDLIESSGKLTIKRALPIFVQICDALAFAHKRDIVHRDLKPSNIMLSGKEDSPDFAKVVDFGIAKIIREHTEESTKLTKTGEIFGSPLYMSPEQCLGQPVDRRSDIYSFGILMYEVLKGKPPLEGPDPLSTMFKQMNDKPEDLGNIDPDARLVQSVESIIFKCMSKSPASRYQNMESVKTDLERAITLGDRGSKTLAKVLRFFASLQRAAAHELASAAKSQRKLLILTTSMSLVLLPIIWTTLWLWPLRYALGAVPNKTERTIDLVPIILDRDKAKALPKVYSDNAGSQVSLLALNDLSELSDLEPCLTKANQYFNAGLYQEAIPFYRAAQTICLKNKMEDSTEIFQANTCWAQCLLRLHIYPAARALATEALGRLSKVAKGENADALLVSGIIANCYYADGRFDDALQSFDEFLSRLTPINIVSCKKPFELAYCLSIAGKFYQDRNEPSKADKVLKMAESLWEQLSQQTPSNADIQYDWGVSQNYLGLVKASLKDYAEAHNEFRRSASNLAKTKGENNLDWAKAEFNDSDALWELNQWYESLQERSRAKRVWANTYQSKST